MSVAYILPLQRAWARARDMLFQRFGIEDWAVLGFAAFLAGLVDTGLLNSWHTRWTLPLRPFELTDVTVLGVPASLFDETWLALAAPLVALSVVVLLVLLWVGSRGKFVFLDNALGEGRPAIVEPWKRFQSQGDSLFLWRIALWLGGFVVLGLAALPLALLEWDNPVIVVPVVVSFLIAMVLSLVFALVILLLESFIVPIMHARRVDCGGAWSLFLPLLRRCPLEFLLFAFFVLIVWVLIVGVGIVVATLTCCVIWPILLLLAVPYVRSILLLPLTLTYRLFSVEFLAQFGPDYVNATASPTAISPPSSTRP